MISNFSKSITSVIIDVIKAEVVKTDNYQKINIVYITMQNLSLNFKESNQHLLLMIDLGIQMYLKY